MAFYAVEHDRTYETTEFSVKGGSVLSSARFFIRCSMFSVGRSMLPISFRNSKSLFNY
jgi:hypothetical protein